MSVPAVPSILTRPGTPVNLNSSGVNPVGSPPPEFKPDSPDVPLGAIKPVQPNLVAKAASSASQTQPAPAGRYKTVIVIDNSQAPGISLNAGDKVPDVSHLDEVKAIINTGINKGLKEGQPGYVPIQTIDIAGKDSSEAVSAGIFKAFKQVLASAPRDVTGNPDLRGYAINLSQTVFGDKLAPDEVAVVQQVLHAGADVFVAESNINYGQSNLIGAIEDPPGAGKLYFVGGSDSKIGRNPESSTPSTQNPWSDFDPPGRVNSVGNSDLLIKPVVEHGKQAGFDINGDGKNDFPNVKLVDTSALEKPFVGKPLAGKQVTLAQLRKADSEIDAEVARSVKRDPSLEEKTEVASQRMAKLYVQIRDKYLEPLKGKLISVDDTIALSVDKKNQTVPTYIVGNDFRMDQHVPTGLGVNRRMLYVSTDALFNVNGRYGDDLVFFNKRADGTIEKLPDGAHTSAHTPSANSTAAPWALVRTHFAK